MARNKVFPENRSLQARIDCVIQGFSQCRSTLKNVKEFALEYFPEKIRGIMARQIDEALADAELASNAIAGDD